MGYESYLLSDNGLIVSYGHGKIKATEILGSLKQIAHNPSYRQEFDRLIVIDDDACLSEIDLHVLKSVVTTLHGSQQTAFAKLRTAKPTSFRMAVVCNNSLNKSIIDLYVAMLGNTPTIDVTYDDFLTVEEAINWLEGETQ